MDLNNREVTEFIRMERFEDIYEKFTCKQLCCRQAAELLGCSERHFLRLRRKLEDAGLDSLRDGRVGRVSPHRAADEEVERITALYKGRYQGMSVAHFYDFAVAKHGLVRSYNWTRQSLNKSGLVAPSKRGGPHRLRRPRRPMRGMMLHQDGSTHQWVPGQSWDLIVTLDDATSGILSGFFVDEESTNSTFIALQEVINTHGLFCSLYTDRGSHYFYTDKAGQKVDKGHLTQVGRALKQLNIQHIPAYSPQARGRSERVFQTLQDRLVKELALEGITDMAGANRYLKKVYIPAHNKRFAVEPADAQSAFMPTVGLDISNILCLQEDRVVQNDNTVRFEGLILQIPATPYRHHYVRTKVQVHKYPDENLALFYGPMCIGRYTATGLCVTNEMEDIMAA